MLLRSLLPLPVAALLLAAPVAAQQGVLSNQIATLPFYALRDPVQRAKTATPYTIAAPLPKVRTALLRVMKDAGIDVKTDDSVSVLIGTPRIVKTGSLGKERLSQIFSCGNGFNGPIADYYRMTFAVLATLEPVETGTLVTFYLAAEARTVEGVSNDPIDCLTIGVFEKKLADRTKLQLAKDG